MRATNSLNYEIIIRSVADTGEISERAVRFDTASRQPTRAEVFEQAEKLKIESSSEEGFEAVMVRAIHHSTAYSQIDAKNTTELHARSIQTTLI